MVFSTTEKHISVAKKLVCRAGKIMSAADKNLPGGRNDFPGTKKIVTVPCIIICAIEKTVWLMDFRWTCIVRDPAYV